MDAFNRCFQHYYNVLWSFKTNEGYRFRLILVTITAKTNVVCVKLFPHYSTSLENNDFMSSSMLIFAINLACGFPWLESDLVIFHKDMSQGMVIQNGMLKIIGDGHRKSQIDTNPNPLVHVMYVWFRAYTYVCLKYEFSIISTK